MVALILLAIALGLLLIGLPCISLPLIIPMLDTWTGLGSLLLLVAFELAGVAFWLALMGTVTS